MPSLFAPEQGFRIKNRLYFTDLMHRTTRSPLLWFVDPFRPPKSVAVALRTPREAA
jgi:hypothetical protein